MKTANLIVILGMIVIGAIVGMILGDDAPERIPCRPSERVREWAKPLGPIVGVSCGRDEPGDWSSCAATFEHGGVLVIECAGLVGGTCWPRGGSK